MNLKTIIKGAILLLNILFLVNLTFAVEANNTLKLEMVSYTDDTAVLDLFVINPSNQQIASVQAWLEYDANKLKGKSIDTESSPFDFVIPGESNFEGNLVKIGRSTLGGDTTSDKIFVARITFNVMEGGGEIAFHDYQVGDGGHVSIQVFDKGFPVNTLESRPSSVILGAKNEASDPSIEFDGTLERPKNFMLTTAIGSITAKWDEVDFASSYYLYYGNTSGRYLQRRQVGKTDIYKFEGLETGKKYFFALTAVAPTGKESQYSDEVAVTVGDAKSSTSPLFEEINLPANIMAPKTEDKIESTKPNNSKSQSRPLVVIKKNTETGPAEILVISIGVALVMTLVTSFRRKRA